MPRERPTTPRGHGEVLTRPSFDEWAALAEQTAERASSWRFTVGGVSAVELRQAARSESIRRAKDFSARLGVPVDSPAEDPGLVAVTGHQPELYHCGVWVKAFLLQRFAEQTGAAAIDLVVDSDTFDSVSVSAPCRRPDVTRCTGYLAIGGRDSCYACSPVPTPQDISTFEKAVLQALSSLHAPAIARHFGQFASALTASAGDARDLAELVTFARRRYEASAHTTYLELPASAQADTDPFRRFMVDMLLDAVATAEAYDHELAAYRKRAGIRSNAQPFPDLRRDGELVETLFWHLADRERQAVWVRPGSRTQVIAGDEVLIELPSDVDAAVDALAASGLRFAPKAVALTLFDRLFVADLFIHGVGGGAYDRFTDALIARRFGIEPPRFAVASMTMYLPLGAHVVTDEELDSLRQRINRLRHNPDQLMAEVEFDDRGEALRAHVLSDEKARLVEEIARPDADKKTLGSRIREVNQELAEMLSPMADEMERRLAELERQKAASDVLTDRTYPFCLWNPEEIRDKAY